ncbi:MAG TPA: transposase [Candidatus Mailhella merdavium]|nr:transposase [Candidatus Mailhella merdavium]
MTSLKTSGSDLSLYCRQKLLLVEGDRLVTSETFAMLYVHWMLRTGSPWRALPEKYGSWKTVYSRFRRWQKRGYLTAIL